MRLFALAMFLFQCVCSSQAFALTPIEKNAQCRALAPGEWSYAYDTEAEALAQLYLDKAGLGYTPVVCLGHAPVGSTAFAEGHIVRVAQQPHFFILLNGQMRLELFDELRGLMAHEVAHLALPESRKCGTYYQEKNFTAYTNCEHAVDALGELWGSKGDVRRALLFLAQQVKGIDWKGDSVGPLLLDLLERRVRLLE